jgi:hypothetical protein
MKGIKSVIPIIVKNLRFRTIGIGMQKSYEFQTFGASL